MVTGVACPDDEHSDREPERHRPVCLGLHRAVSRCRGERHSYVTRQRLRPVRVSCMDEQKTTLVYDDHINVRNSSHGFGSLRRRRVSCLVQHTCKQSLSLLVRHGIFQPHSLLFTTFFI